MARLGGASLARPIRFLIAAITTNPSIDTMNYFNAYAASSIKAPLEPFSFDPGELGPEEVHSYE